MKFNFECFIVFLCLLFSNNLILIRAVENENLDIIPSLLSNKNVNVNEIMVLKIEFFHSIYLQYCLS